MSFGSGPSNVTEEDTQLKAENEQLKVNNEQEDVDMEMEHQRWLYTKNKLDKLKECISSFLEDSKGPTKNNWIGPDGTESAPDVPED